PFTPRDLVSTTPAIASFFKTFTATEREASVYAAILDTTTLPPSGKALTSLLAISRSLKVRFFSNRAFMLNTLSVCLLTSSQTPYSPLPTPPSPASPCPPQGLQPGRTAAPNR